MRILSRRTPAPADSRYLVMPRRPQVTADPVESLAPGGRRDARAEHATVSAVLARATAPAAAVRRRLADSSRSTAPAAPVRRTGPHTGRNRLIVRRRPVLVGLLALTALLFVLAPLRLA